MAKKSQAKKSASKILIRKILILIGVIAIVITPIIIFSPRTSFEAVVTNVYASVLEVEVSGNEQFNGTYLISIDEDTQILDINKEEINLQDIQIDTSVKIVFDGKILETNPARIDGCFKVLFI